MVLFANVIVGKGNRSRVLYLPDRAAEHMRRYVEEFHGTGAEPGRYLFWSRNHSEGTAPLSQDAVTKLLRRHAATAAATCRDVPLDITPHRLRHARATHWLDRGMRLAQVSLMLGHASVQTTMDYLDVSVEAKSEAMQSMADAPGSRYWKAAGAMSLLGAAGLRERADDRVIPTSPRVRARLDGWEREGRDYPKVGI